MQPGERSRLLHHLVDALEARQEEIAEAEMRDGGCTWRKAYLLDIPVGLIHLRHFAKLADFDPMEPVPQIAGTASAAIGASTMTAGAIAGYETTRIGGSDPTIFALVVVVMGTLAFVLAITAAILRRRRVLV